MASKEYNRLDRIALGRFYGLNIHETGRGGSSGNIDARDMENMTADEFPAGMARKRRTEILFPCGMKKGDVPGDMIDPAATTPYKIYVAEDPDYADATQVCMPFEAQEGWPAATEWFDVRVSSETRQSTDCTVFTFMNDAEGRLAVREAARIKNAGKDVQITARRFGTTDGGVTDACTIGDKMYLATESGSITGNEKILQTWQPIRQIVPIGRRIFTDTGYLIDEDLTAATPTRVQIPVTGTESATVALVDEAGSTITPATTKPVSPANGDYWFDSVTNGLYQYSSAQDMWVATAESNIQITYGSAQAALGNIKKGDAVRITINGNKGEHIVTAVTSTVLTVRGMTMDTGAQSVRVEKRMPVLDFICEHNNRMWGVRYGENDDGEFVNEIYASALGEPGNWFCYEGLSGDSWTTSLGEPGPWTGITECGDYVYAFKADKIFVISGSQPSNFNYKTIDDWGVQPGSEKSICVIDNYCYYKSEHGVMRIGQYSFPVCVSRALGADIWKEAIAGTDGRKYYLSMREDIYLRTMFVYDTETGIWTRESEPVTGMRTFLRYQNNLMAIGLKRQLELVTGCRILYSAAKDAADTGATALEKATRRALSKALTMTTAKAVGALYSKTTPAALAEYINTTATIYCTAATTKASVPATVWVSDERTEAAAAANSLQIASIGMSGFDVQYTETGQGELQKEGPVEWYYETGPLGLDLPDEKTVRKIQLRVKCPRTADVSVWISYDESGEWEEIAHRDGVRGTYRIAYTPGRRCDTFRLRIRGRDDTVIYGIYITTEGDGDYAY